MGKKLETKARTLADFSLRQLGEEFEIALRKLTGKAYSVEILALDKRPKGELAADLYEIADLRVRVREHQDDQPDIEETQPTRTLKA